MGQREHLIVRCRKADLSVHPRCTDISLISSCPAIIYSDIISSVGTSLYNIMVALVSQTIDLLKVLC